MNDDSAARIVTLVFASALAACSGDPGGSPPPGAGSDVSDVGEADAGDTSEDVPVLCTEDPDGDGFGDGPECPDVDCAPNDALSYPGAAERCGDGLDNDCDGEIDEDCACPEGAAEPCYTGPAGTANVGICGEGVRRCVDGTWSACDGERLPEGPAETACDGRDEDCDGDVDDDGVRNACGECGAVLMEVCGDGLDNDCDGAFDEPDAGCDCDERTAQPCYSGPPTSLGFGRCRGGVTDCVDGAWAVCVGEVLPIAETCNGEDDDCDGLVDEGLLNACGQCGVPDPVEVCNGIDDDCDGLVDEGVRLACGLCPGEVADEICDDGLDNDCDGEVDEGCVCSRGEPSCYPGPPDTRGVGACADGARSCDATGEFWGACEGFTLPTPEACNGIDDDCDGVVDVAPNGCSVCGSEPETCNGVDDDCDGLIDEGLINACGQCIDQVGGETVCDGLDDNCNGLIDEGLLNACGTCDDSCYLEEYDDPEGWLEGTLDGIDDDLADGLRLGTTLLRQPDLWVANTNDGTVTRIDTDTAEVVGTYPVGADPSRTAVDFDGNVWVANRAFGQQGTVTKVLDEGCEGDDCVAFTVPVGTNDGIPRGLAIDRFGFVWVGLYNDELLVRLRPDTGEVVGSYDVGLTIYGLAIDAEGLIWMSGLNDNVIAAFDPEEESLIGPFSPPGCSRTYGIAVDASGDLWFGNWTCDNLVRLVRSTLEDEGGPTFEAYEHPNLPRTRGVAIDASGAVYVASSGTDRLGKFDPAIADRIAAGETTDDGGNPLTPWVWTVETCNGPIGVGIASDGNIWTVCRDNNRATRFTPDGDQLETVRVGNAPYSYSDITGFQLRNFTAPSGFWRVVFECGRPNCAFDEITWDAVTPEGTEVAVRARVGDDSEPRVWTDWTERVVGSPADLRDALPAGAAIEVEVRLTSEDPEVSPTVSRVDVAWQRP